MSTSTLQKDLLVTIEEGLQELDFPSSPETLYQPYRYAIGMGGKRIRPLLTLLSSGLCGGEPDKALPAALALEILHNFTLVHDDIMDSADTRRGQESVFRKWNENVAILSGDVMFADAYRQLEYYGSEQSFTKAEFTSLLQIFREAVVTVCEGQALDMEFVDRRDVSHDEYIEMISGKTAALLSASLEMGAVIAHATDKQRENLRELGKEMGITFQIQDDYLDATADPEKFGKRPGGDIYEGKKTYLTILTLERADEKQASFMQEILDRENPSQDEVENVLDIMNTTGVLDEVGSEIVRHYNKALNLLDGFADSEYKQELENLIIFLKERDH